MSFYRLTELNNFFLYLLVNSRACPLHSAIFYCFLIHDYFSRQFNFFNYKYFFFVRRNSVYIYPLYDEYVS